MPTAPTTCIFCVSISHAHTSAERLLRLSTWGADYLKCCSRCELCHKPTVASWVPSVTMLPLVLDTRALRRQKTGQLRNWLPFSGQEKREDTSGGMEGREGHKRWLCKDTPGGQESGSEVWRHRAGGLSDAVGPVNFVLQLRIAHERREWHFLMGACTTPLQMTWIHR